MNTNSAPNATIETPAAAPVLEIKTLAQAIAKIVALESVVVALETRVAKIETKPEPVKTEGREMTDDDARKIMFGEFAGLKHKEVAEKLGLSYGQIYSCRLGFTFKSIHKEMREAGHKNPWMK